MAGEQLTAWARRRLAAKVRRAERVTGMQVVVYVGPTEDHPKVHALRILADADDAGLEVVLLLVATDRRHVEVRTTAAARPRLDDEAAADVVGAVVGVMAARRRAPRRGSRQVAAGVSAGVGALMAALGSGPRGAVELPDVVGG